MFNPSFHKEFIIICFIRKIHAKLHNRHCYKYSLFLIKGSDFGSLILIILHILDQFGEFRHQLLLAGDDMTVKAKMLIEVRLDHFTHHIG